MPITMFDHYTVRARDLDASARFYSEVMGMRCEAIDDFDFPIRALFSGEQAIVHLLGAGPALDGFLQRSAPSHADGPARKTGNMEHVAFNGTGAQDFIARLQQAGMPYVARPLPAHGVFQLLFDDPDGVEIEVNFPLAEGSS